MASKMPWSDKWALGKKLQHQGAQGETWLARRIDDDPERFDYVLKHIPVDSKQRFDRRMKRRRRLYTEMAAMKAASGVSGVVEFVDSNADDFRQPDIPIYVVTKRVNGTDLAQFVSLNGSLTLRDAVTVTEGVLETLMGVHPDIVHRDIKPQHIILRNDEFEEPVLIDFGLAHIDEVEIGFETDVKETVGNRFLILPEQMDPGGKTDARSDVTQCVGALFFLLTGTEPGLLIENEKYPHQRHEFPKCNERWRESLLRRIFDVGFQTNLNHRWQSAQLLKKELDNTISDSPPQEVDPQELMNELAKQLRSGDSHLRAARFKNLKGDAENHLRELANACNTGGLSDFVSIGHGSQGRVPSRIDETCTITIHYDLRLPEESLLGWRVLVELTVSGSVVSITTTQIEAPQNQDSEPVIRDETHFGLHDEQAYEHWKASITLLIHQILKDFLT